MSSKSTLRNRKWSSLWGEFS